MTEKLYPVLQRIINRAYDDHNKPEYTREQFWFRLDYAERIAVHCVNLYNQVCNGGFLQWHNNGYSSAVQELLMCLREIKQTDVAHLVTQAMTRIEAYEEQREDARNQWGEYDEEDRVDFDDLNAAFDNGLGDAFLDAVEAYLTQLQ